LTFLVATPHEESFAMKKLMLLAAGAALLATGCGRPWWSNYGCGQNGYAMGDCCDPCGGGGDAMYGGYGMSPGFTTGYVPGAPAPVLPGPEIVPAAPAR
jgi:hypothetical protein